MKKLVLDLDYTIARKIDSYENAEVQQKVKEKVIEYKNKGYHISFYTARNMKTFNSSIELITENTLPKIIDWLRKNEIPFDEIIVGKPWNDEGFYVDDNAIRPSEFVGNSEEEIFEILKKDREKQWR